MSKPVVAIVGRPNVGKSTLFNHIIGERKSITEDTPGVTRDRIYGETHWRGREFFLVDTGGIEPFSDDNMLKHMRIQAQLAIDTADVIIFLVDGKEGLLATDHDVYDMLRKTKKPTVLAINKIDNIGDPPQEVYEFYNLAAGDFVTISSSHGLGMGDLLDAVYDHFPGESISDTEGEAIRVSVIGKPNVGKSSLINKILGEERLIVTDTPGTTRDAVDTYVSINERDFIFIDTAGVRRKSRISDNIEHYSIIRAFAAIDKSDVCIMMIDAQDGVTDQDTKIAGYAHERGKGLVIAINKWDLIEKETGTLEEYRRDVYGKLSFLTYAPTVFISALTGQRINTLFRLIVEIDEETRKRISTGLLNSVLNDALAMVQPPSDRGRRLRIYYMTQVGIKPPTFVLFVNEKKLMHYSYLRYLENQIRRTFGFKGTPIILIVREKSKEDL